MDEKNIQISFIGMEPTEALKKYTLEKLQKYDNFLKDATNIEIFLKENLYSRGIKEDFRIDINVMLPKSPVRVEVVGENMYANIDEAMDILARRLKRYHDRVGNWEGKEPWKVLEAEAALEALGEEEEEEIENYAEYIPKIAVRKKIKDMSPMEEAEAIEKMELLGYGQLLFKNKNTGKISMVYRRERGGYGLVEPEDDVLD
jgi:putative sigma-54 modulation protein